MAGWYGSEADGESCDGSSFSLEPGVVVLLAAEDEAYRRAERPAEVPLDIEILPGVENDVWSVAIVWRDREETEGRRQESKGDVRDRKRVSPKRRISIVILYVTQ
jgi:hypothetical protein